MVATTNPLELLTDEELDLTQIALAIGCGRRRTVLRDKHRTKLCGLFMVLDTEQTRRGRVSPAPPFKA